MDSHTIERTNSAFAVLFEAVRHESLLKCGQQSKEKKKSFYFGDDLEKYRQVLPHHRFPSVLKILQSLCCPFLGGVLLVFYLSKVAVNCSVNRLLVFSAVSIELYQV